MLRGALEAALRSHARIRLHDSKTLIWNAAGEEPHGIAALQPAGADPVSTSSSSLYPADQPGLLVLGTPLGSDAYVQRVLRDRRGVQDSALHVACSRRSPIRAVSPVFLCVSASKLPSPHAPTGSGVARNVRLADVNIDVPVSADRRIEVVTNELSLGHGARQAVDAYHTRALDPHPAAHVHPGRAADGTARRKRRQTYPELECARLVVVGLKSAAAGTSPLQRTHLEFGRASQCRWVVFGIDWSIKSANFVRLSARALQLARRWGVPESKTGSCCPAFYGRSPRCDPNPKP